MMDAELKAMLVVLLGKLEGLERRLSAVEAVAHKQVVVVPNPNYLPSPGWSPPNTWDLTPICTDIPQTFVTLC